MKRLPPQLSMLMFLLCFISDLYGQVLLQSKTENYDFPCSCEGSLDVSPRDGDFLPTKAGRILISTEHDNIYYTPFQTEDGQVKIQASISADFDGTELFFRVVDDLDDLSSYEIEDNPPGDNRDASIGSGVLDNDSAIATVSPGGALAIAEVTLTITDRFSGDNYQVEVSCDSDFTNVAKTSVFVAWKRIYVEFDKMYKKGGTIISPFESDSDTEPDLLRVDNTTDFAVDDIIVLLSPPSVNQPNVTLKVESKSELNTTDLFVYDDNEETFNFPGGSGVKIDGQDDTFDIPLDLIKDAFGSMTSGENGGTFVEFKWNFYGGGPVPKLTQYDSFDLVEDLSIFWRNPECDPDMGNICKNYIQVVAAHDFVDPQRGTSKVSSDLTVLFIENIESQVATNVEATKSEVLVHELGHQFFLSEGTFPVVHDNTDDDFTNHEGSDQGVMSWDRNIEDGEAEFFIDCIFHIRDLLDGI